MAMTLRLTDDEEKALTGIKEALGCTTLTSTIKSMIALHSELAKNLDAMTQAAGNAIQERDAIKEEVANYLTAQRSLEALVSPEWHDEITHRLEAHEQGRSVTYSREEVNSLLEAHLNAIRD